MEVATRKISNSEAKELYNELIQKDINALEREESHGIGKYNIMDLLMRVNI